MLGPATHLDLIRAEMQAIVTLELAHHSFTQGQGAGYFGIAGLIAINRFFGRLTHMLGGCKVRLALTEGNHRLSLLPHLIGQTRHLFGGRCLGSQHALGQRDLFLTLHKAHCVHPTFTLKTKRVSSSGRNIAINSTRLYALACAKRPLSTN